MPGEGESRRLWWRLQSGRPFCLHGDMQPFASLRGSGRFYFGDGAHLRDVSPHHQVRSSFRLVLVTAPVNHHPSGSGRTRSERPVPRGGRGCLPGVPPFKFSSALHLGAGKESYWVPCLEQ